MSSKNFFAGKFRVISLYCYVKDHGWKLLRRYGKNSFMWEFEQERQIKIPSGEIVYKGKLREHFAASPKEMTGYIYYPSEHLLHIDRSGYTRGTVHSICINDRYRVEHIRDNEYWLYDLEGVEKEPEGYRFRMKIRMIE